MRVPGLWMGVALVLAFVSTAVSPMILLAKTSPIDSPNQEFLWTRQFGTSSRDDAHRVSADGSAVFVAGETEGTLPGQTSAGGLDAFLRKYDDSGTLLWTRQFGSSTGDRVRGVAVHGTDLYISGWTEGTLPGQTSAGSSDAFLRKYDDSGTCCGPVNSGALRSTGSTT